MSTNITLCNNLTEWLPATQESIINLRVNNRHVGQKIGSWMPRLIIIQFGACKKGIIMKLLSLDLSFWVSYSHVPSQISIVCPTIVTVETFKWFISRMFPQMNRHVMRMDRMIRTFVANMFVTSIRSLHIFACFSM